MWHCVIILPTKPEFFPALCGSVLIMWPCYASAKASPAAPSPCTICKWCYPEVCSAIHRWTTWCSSFLPSSTAFTGCVSSAIQNGAKLQTLYEESGYPEKKAATCRVLDKKWSTANAVLWYFQKVRPGRTNCSENTNITVGRKMSFSSPKTSRGIAVHRLDSPGFMFELDLTGNFQCWWFYETVTMIMISQSALRET